jgi:hypothetical protein
MVDMDALQQLIESHRLISQYRASAKREGDIQKLNPEYRKQSAEYHRGRYDAAGDIQREIEKRIIALLVGEVDRG